MKTIDFIKNKYNLDLKKQLIKLPLDRFRLFPSLLNELKLRRGAEIGVLEGWFSRWLFTRIQGLKLFLIDPYLAYDDQTRRRGQEEMDESEIIAKTRLAGYNCEFIKKTSIEALKDIPDESLDFVYIDGNHAFDWVMEDIIHWSKKVRKGGVVSGHDYSPDFPGVQEAVDVWVRVKKIKPLFLIGNKTWFYIK